jgi:hypothetical protein
VTPVWAGRHWRFRAGPGILCRGRRAVAGNAPASGAETLIRAVMRGGGTAGGRLGGGKFAARAGRPGSYFPVRFTSR